MLHRDGDEIPYPSSAKVPAYLKSHGSDDCPEWMGESRELTGVWHAHRANMHAGVKRVAARGMGGVPKEIPYGMDMTIGANGTLVLHWYFYELFILFLFFLGQFLGIEEGSIPFFCILWDKEWNPILDDEVRYSANCIAVNFRENRIKQPNNSNRRHSIFLLWRIMSQMTSSCVVEGDRMLSVWRNASGCLRSRKC